jgi:hypothetical protein
MLFVVLVVGICGVPAFAQKYEVHPYAGGQWMTDYNSPLSTQTTLDFKNPAMFGLKGGVAVTDNIMIEGNGAWINQFNFRNFNYRTHAYLYEIAGQYNFAHVNIRGVRPFVSLGVGGTTIDINSEINTGDHDAAVYPIVLDKPIFGNSPIPRTMDAFVLKSGDSFFNFSYGGGLKGQRLWGPMGVRADFRGRTMPNFFNSKVHTFEATGGLLFSWGER